MTTVTIPEDEGVEYQVDGKTVNGTVEAEGTVVVKAVPKPGYKFSEGAETEWTFESSAETNTFEPREDTDTLG